MVVAAEVVRGTVLAIMLGMGPAGILALCSHCGCGHVRAPVLYSQMLVIMGSALQVPVVALQGVALHIDGSAEDHSFDTTVGQHS